MSVSWADIAFEMPPEVTDEVRDAWSWLLPEAWEPVLCSKIGEFHETCRSKPNVVDEWFLPALVARLHEAGKTAGPGECYGFTILPVFAEGKYTPENMFVLPVREQFVGVADIHKQLADLPDGASVQVKVID